jgi:gliding motility-associated lipoprotein GldD
MTAQNSILSASIVLMILFSFSCGSNYAPKPRGYFRITLPEKEYTRIDTTLPYSFEHPVYSTLKSDKGPNNEPYWTNLVFPGFDAQVHLSYRRIEDNLYQLLEDNRELAYKHTVKADAIQERLFESPNEDIYGILYEIQGNTASQVQFFATDSTRHFLRGSLYFNAVPNKDSIAPVLEFVKEDIVHMMESLRWKEL